jgi:hypothetical protein
MLFAYVMVQAIDVLIHPAEDHDEVDINYLMDSLFPTLPGL